MTRNGANCRWTVRGTIERFSATVTDGENNRTSYEYDGHDRLAKTRLPVATQGAATSSTTDYEQVSYDAGSNIVSRRLRDGTSIGYSYDALNRLIAKDLPGSEPDVGYSYDALSRMTGASQSGNALTFAFDALSRLTGEGGPHGTTGFAYDSGGRRTRITHADGFYVDQDYLVTGETWKIRENGATSGVGVLATYAYDDLGRRTSLTRGNGTAKSYGYDPVSRLTSLGEDAGAFESARVPSSRPNAKHPSRRWVTPARAHFKWRCEARRINKDAFPPLALDACNPGTSGTRAPDRILRSHYDPFGRRFGSKRRSKRRFGRIMRNSDIGPTGSASGVRRRGQSASTPRP